MSCCDELHDVQAKLDVPGQVRFVMVCARCGREQREVARQPYTPTPRFGCSAPLAVEPWRARHPAIGAAASAPP